jgi:hypothetical protein
MPGISSGFLSLNTPIILEVPGLLVMFVTRPIHEPRLCEVAASSINAVQNSLQPICRLLAAWL